MANWRKHCKRIEPELGSTAGHARAELVVNAVADAFLSPTSIAALEILIATRSARADPDQQASARTVHHAHPLGRYVADGLEPDRADAVGNVIWTTLMGAMVAKMAVPGPSMSVKVRALTDVIAAYVDHHRTT